MAFNVPFNKSLVSLCITILASFSAQGQLIKRTTNWVLHHSIIDTTTPGQPSFRLYPTLAYAPETNLEIGLTTLYLFQARKDTGNRISELNMFSFFTLRSQYGIWLENAVYGHKDKWIILGKIRFQRFPLLYYGIGPNTPKDQPATIDGTNMIFRQRLLRKIGANLFLGPEVDYQLLSNTSVEHHPEDMERDLPVGASGSSNLGVGAAIVYDNRYNMLNVRKGTFAELGILTYSDKLGSTYNFTGVNVDIRNYRPINKRDVLALQVIGNFLTGTVPFNQMALMGGETMMRGYYSGRYRDKNLIAGQAEYRMLPFAFSKRIGVALFASTAVVSPTIPAIRFDNLQVAAGAGIRYLLFPKKDIFVRFDVGVTKEGVGFYFFTGEAF